MRTPLIYIVLYCLLNGCRTQNILSPIDSKVWKQDSIGCLGQRTNIYYTLLNEDEKFVGKLKSQITDNFGEANLTKQFKEGEMLYYFIKGGPQCEESFSEEDLQNWDVELMYIFINDKNEVEEMGGMKQ
ncbi:MAG TPA: hypothetical protein DCG19_07270 [Cryomorphaceae bacterium]|nr:hypothetical protein [Owenweeksia sp.]MBF97391.1 hypothetical protein [Owenweeksia sp.]HAD97191.1 hypothetical protein [Cryomorphaceae bacterium]HBF18555.1 hypothetical protein [Cryomorphaceae bacterium]|tara:strand:- start:2686 stop:3072 length:387 start_codon:yes stop_codon:yes gene_type:complete